MENYPVPQQVELPVKISGLFNKINDILYSSHGSGDIETMNDDSIKEVIIDGNTALETARDVTLLDIKNQRCINITKITSIYSEGGNVAEDRVIVKVRRYGEDMYRSGEKLATVYQYNQTSNQLEVFGHMRGTWGYYADDYKETEDVNHYVDLLQNYVDNGLVLDEQKAGYVNELYNTKRNPWPKITEYLNKNGIKIDDEKTKPKKIAQLLKRLRK